MGCKPFSLFELVLIVGNVGFKDFCDFCEAVFFGDHEWCNPTMFFDLGVCSLLEKEFNDVNLIASGGGIEGGETILCILKIDICIEKKLPFDFIDVSLITGLHELSKSFMVKCIYCFFFVEKHANHENNDHCNDDNNS